MCEPTTIALAATIASTAVTAYGAYQQGQTAKKIANYNAKMNEYSAEDAIKRGSIEADQQRAKARQMLASQRAAMGASGLEETGTLGNVLQQTATLGELDARQIEANAQREAWGMRSQANIARYEGAARAQAGALEGFGTLIGGAARAWGMYKSPNVGGGTKSPSFMNRPGSYNPNIYG